MATLYWGGGTGTWDGFTTANWYTDLARTVLSTRAPSAVDDVIFDAASNATAYTVTIANNTTVCQSCTISGPATGNLTLTGAGLWNIFGNLTLPATGLTRTFTGTIVFRGAGAITTNGVTLASNTTFSGSGTYTLQDALNIGTSQISLNSGTLDTNDKNLTCGIISAPAATTATLTLGASTVTATSFTFQGPLVINGGTSNVTLSSVNANIGATTGYLGSTFYNVTFSSLTISASNIYGNNTFNNLTFATRSTATVSNINLFGNQTVNGTLTIAGQSSVNRYFVRSNINGTTRTLTAGTVAALTDVDFRDIAVAGASAPWSGTRLGDCGGNTNITFPSAKTVYWNSTAGGLWTGDFWATVSGGAVSLANFPLAQDTAIIDDAGLNSGATISGGTNYNLGTLTSTRTNTFVLSTSPIIYGDVTLTSSTIASSFTPTFAGRITQNLTSAGNRVGGIVSNGYSNNVKFLDNIDITNFTVSSGGLDTNDKNFTITGGVTIGTVNTGAFSLTLGSSSVSIAGANGFGSSSATAPTITVNAGTSTITLNNGAASFGFAGQTLTWYNVIRSIGSIPEGNLFGANTFNNLTLTTPTSNGATSLIVYGNQTVSGTLGLGGGASATQRLFLQSNIPGTQRTITAATVTGLSDVDFRDISGAGAATWTGGTRIGDCGGNSGIGFDAPKTVYWNLAGSQNWNSTAWATTPTGTPAVNNFPLAQDTAVFTDSGNAGTITLQAHNIGTIDASGRTSAMTFSGSSNVNIYGNITYGSGITSLYSLAFVFFGTTTQTFTTAGKTLASIIRVNNPSCNFQHGDAYTSTSTSSGAIEIIYGTYNTLNYNISVGSFLSNSVNTRILNFGTSTLTLSGQSPINFGSTGLTFNGASSTINLSSTLSKNFNGGGQTFGTVSSAGGITNALTISGNNTFDTLTNSAYTNLIFASGTTQTVTNFTYTGASGSQVRWYATLPGIGATLKQSPTGGSLDAIGANSVDGGNNTGFTFTGSSPDYFYVKDMAFISGISPNVTVNVTGVAATGQIGTVIIPNELVQVAGVSATGQVGTVTVTTQQFVTVSVTGVSATGQIGSVVVRGAATVLPTGVTATGEVGTVAVIEGQGVDVALTGVEATGEIGTVTIIEGQGVDVSLTGVEATGEVGTVTVVEGQGILVPVTGVAATGLIGDVSISASANVFPAGVVGYGLIGTVNVWGLVDDTQNADWQIINNTQPSTWTQIPT